MSKFKYKHQANKIKNDRENKVIIQIGISIRSKDHDLIERLKNVTGNTNIIKLRNLLDLWDKKWK